MVHMKNRKARLFSLIAVCLLTGTTGCSVLNYSKSLDEPTPDAAAGAPDLAQPLDTIDASVMRHDLSVVTHPSPDLKAAGDMATAPSCLTSVGIKPSCPTGTTCLCDPSGNAYCDPYSSIALPYCYQYQRPGGSVEGFCAMTCRTACSDSYAICPSTIAGTYVDCRPTEPPNNLPDGVCFPVSGYDGADLMPYRCTSDSDCMGKVASP